MSIQATGTDSTTVPGLEGRLDASLDHVQIHTGPTAQQACEEVNARAFAVGNHIAFGPGEYDPESPKGQHLIAHEVVHTLQQPDAPISMMPKTEVEMEVDPDPAAEREADEIAGQVMRGWETGLEGEMADTEIHVQRFTGAIAGAALAGAATKGRLETIVDVRNNCSSLGARVDQSLL